jgi:16S rRNA (adenine1518-N6/adenine1519-N6)-dimethyltransferase
MSAFQAFRARGLQSKKGLGQHFLVDERAVLRIVEAAALSKEDMVVEVGPGPGTLTVHLAQQAGHVVAVEVDEQMLGPLHEVLRGCDNVQIVHGDILAQDVRTLTGGKPYKVVANLPYYITSAALRHFLSSVHRPERIVVTVQREVADRIIGRTSKRGRGQRVDRMSLLAVSVQFYGRPRIVARVPAGAFRPIPAVDSAIVCVEVYDRLPWGQVNEHAFFQVVRAGFAESRKQLRNTLAHNLALSADQVLRGMQAAGIDGQRRAETLAVEEWVALSRVLDAALQAGSNDG